MGNIYKTQVGSRLLWMAATMDTLNSKCNEYKQGLLSRQLSALMGGQKSPASFHGDCLTFGAFSGKLVGTFVEARYECPTRKK